MDLAAARSGDASAVQRERSRFMRAIQPLLQHDGPKLLVTDSQVGAGVLLARSGNVDSICFHWSFCLECV
jgi:hypothetical protein